MHVLVSRCILEILIPIVSGKWLYQVFSERSHHLSVTSLSLHHFLQSCPQLAHFPHLLCCGLSLLTHNLRGVSSLYIPPAFPTDPISLRDSGPSFSSIGKPSPAEHLQSDPRKEAHSCVAGVGGI